MKSIPVFYTPKMVADYRCASPSAAKPSKVVGSWNKRFSIDIHEPTPVTVDELVRAHDKEFVHDVLACKRHNGFGDKSIEVASAQPYTSGAMLSAARHAYAHKSVAAAPCSGFHHAGWLSPAGFCTFNGLMVTALALKADGINSVGILDLDMHYGDGTDDIIQKLNIDWIRHWSGGQHFNVPGQAEDFFHRLPDILDWLAHCDVVLYQAGADPHINDPYGGWLTTEQLRVRDAIVFDSFHEQGVPIAWNLAGGYQVEPDGSIPKVLEIHDNTMSECVRVFG